MKAFGALLIVFGLLGAWNGPIDREYMSDWGAFLFAGSLSAIGLWLLFFY